MRQPPSVMDYDLLNQNLLARLAELEGKVKALERLAISTAAADARYLQRVASYAAVTNPPTLTELEEAFGAAATLPNPFFGVLDDGGAGTDLYLCIAVNGKWTIEILTVIT